MKGYPIFLIDLDKKRCVVVGGGREAERKVEGLLDCAAAVTVISAGVTGRLRGWAEAGRLIWLERDYRAGDLRGAFLVIAAGYDAALNRCVWQEAGAERALINVVDDPPHSNFIAGSVVRQGPLTIAISTGGCAPALAVRLRQRFEREFGPEYAAFLELMRELRAPLLQREPDFQTRRALWYELVDSDILHWLRQERPDLARQRIAAIVGAAALAGDPVSAAGD